VDSQGNLQQGGRIGLALLLQQMTTGSLCGRQSILRRAVRIGIRRNGIYVPFKEQIRDLQYCSEGIDPNLCITGLPQILGQKRPP
jgi:hypothetical protein